MAVLLREARARFDAILLDVDNGPAAFTQTSNAGLYDNAGLLMIRAALRPGGVLAVWSAWDDRKFEHRLRHHGFTRRDASRPRAAAAGRPAPHDLRGPFVTCHEVGGWRDVPA